MKRKDTEANENKAESEDERMTVEVGQREPTMLAEVHLEKEQDSVVCGTRSKSHVVPVKNVGLSSLALSSPSEVFDEFASKEDGLMDGKCVRNSIVQRTSARVMKRMKKESIGANSTEAQQVSKKTVKQNPQPEQLRTRRSWELWSVEDKNNFFEALCEYGKDFENIQSFIAHRSRKKGVPPNMIKNKDQVRHFYYRTWHKISKYLDIGDDVKKQTQELYGLINYAELRKKIGGCLNEKNRQKLNELVFHGVTTVKYRGKKLRIKTPICRALKKLNSVEDSKEPESPKLPKEIYVEFRPRTNSAWLHVQNLSQNPRLRTKVSLQRRLSTVISYLEKRWKPLRLQQKEQVRVNVSDPSSKQSFLPDDAPSIRLRPRFTTSVSPLSVSSVDGTSFANVCLEKHVRSLHGEQKLKMKKITRTKCKPKCVITDSDENLENTEKLLADSEIKNGEEQTEKVLNVSETVEKNSISDSEEKHVDERSNPEEEAKRSLTLLKNILQSIDKDPCINESNSVSQELTDHNQNTTCLSNDDHTYPSEEEEHHSTEKPDAYDSVDLYLSTQSANPSITLGQLLSLKSKHSEKSDTLENSKSTETLENKGEEMKPVNEEKQKILEGWTLGNVGLMTVGELYLMLKCPAKLVLEYEFESQESHFSEEKSENKSSVQSEMHQLGVVLKKLVTVAALYFNDFKSKQSPLSPTNRNSIQNRILATLPSKLSAGRSLGRGPGIRTAVRTQADNKSTESSPEQETLSKSVGNTSSESVVTSQSPEEKEVKSSTVESSDKHVFVVPVRAAPRNVNKSASVRDGGQDNVEVMPGRRNQRQKRKPIVVRRALLPRSSGMGPMTVVHLLPSPSPLTAVIPSTSPNSAVQKMVLPPAKKIVKVLPTVSASSVDVTSLQIPLLKPVTSGPSAIVLPTTTLPTAQAVEAAGMVNSVQSLNANLFSLERKRDSIAVPSNTIAHVPAQLPVITTSNSAILTPAVTTMSVPPVTKICITASSGTSPPRISIPDNNSSTNLSPPNISSLLEMSLPEGIPVGSMSGSNTENLLDFNENSSSCLSAAFGLSSAKEQLQSRSKCLSVDPMVSERHSTPPQSPGNRFKVNSPGPDAQWLNGESADFSLNSLLNTFESPCKNSVHSSGDGSSLDSMSRLAPDVDTHLQCLINENSVDYVAKFADLAAQIASTSSESKCS